MQSSTNQTRTIELLARQSQLLAELQTIGAELLALASAEPAPAPAPAPTVVEPEPEPKAKSVPQEKAEANARVALANKGKSAKDKAEALDVPLSTVKKVEKAKAATKAPASDKPMNAAEMKKLAKELGVSYEGIKFTSSKARDSFRATLEQAQAKHEAKVWEGLSPSRQAKLSKAPSVDPNRASARAIAI